jgi:hypothetical protein
MPVHLFIVYYYTNAIPITTEAADIIPTLPYLFLRYHDTTQPMVTPHTRSATPLAILLRDALISSRYSDVTCATAPPDAYAQQRSPTLHDHSTRTTTTHVSTSFFASFFTVC